MQENKSKTTHDRFLQGFMACLTILTQQGREIEATAREAFGSIGRPSNKDLKKAGVDSFDIVTASAIRETFNV